MRLTLAFAGLAILFYDAHTALASDGFLFYPFDDLEVKLQQGWIYTYSDSPHKGIDYDG
ncbi:MAG: hypothetical protein HYV33_03045 [Candidatus Kerfeldbacteria bacterium]|nr:hypothetical protein [Candidatus Kerfeldbacteria bacterium]